MGDAPPEHPSDSVSERNDAEALRRRLAAIVEFSQDAILSKDLNGVITTWNEGARQLFGYEADEVIGKPVTILIPADRQDEEPAILARLRRGEPTKHFDTIRRRKDGSFVHVSLTVSPIRDANGTIIGASKIARDVTDRLRLDEQQSLLLGEMQHRTRNLAAVIEGLARQSQPAGEPAVDAFLSAFLGRLRALFSAGELIVSSSKREADLRQVFEVALEPFIDPAKPTQISFDGPPLAVSEQTSGSFALAAHELATNALKYGALKSPAGQVAIRWSVEPEQDHRRVRIVWKETGGEPIAEPPERRGFGGRVVRAAASRERDGKTELAFEPDGLRCSFEFIAAAGA